MPQPDLIWADKAIHDIKNLLDRRDDREGVLRCVESHLLAAAEDPLVLWTDEGPQPVASHRFECRDGETKLFLQALFQVLGVEKVAVLACTTIEF